MPSRCFVLGCRGNNNNGPKVSCYSFPSNDELRCKWLEVVPLKHHTISKNSKVCELHFVDSDFVKTVSVRDTKTGQTVEYALDQIRLKKDAVPSVFAETLKHYPRNGSLHGHGRRKEIRDVDEDLNLSDSAALTTDISSNNSRSFFNNWEKDETSALIALYELEPCLYDKKDQNYYNKDEKNNAYNRIQQVMTFIRPTCTVSQVKKKIINLRNHYATEKLFKDRSIHNGFSTEDTYEPSLWCFRLLQFLDDHIVQTGRRAYKKLLNENDVNYDFFDDEKSDSFQDNSETNSLTGKQNVSGEIEEDKDEEHERLEKIAETNSDSDEQNVTDEIAVDKNEEYEILITSSEAVGENSEDECNKEPNNDHFECSEDDCRNYQNDETSCIEDEDSNNIGMNDETSGIENEDCNNVGMNDETSCIEDEDSNNVDGINDEVSTREKRKLDSSVSTSKKVKTEKKCDKEDIFGRYVSYEMKTLRHSPLLYLKTKQSILKILTEANFKFINTES